MKTSNAERRAKNTAAIAGRYVTSITERALAAERFRIEHANDCQCDFCQCFGQGTCVDVAKLSPEDQEAARMCI